MSEKLGLFVLLLFCHNGLGNGQEDDVDKIKVFSLQRGVWTPPSDNVYLRFNFSKNAPSVNTLSICYRIRFEVFSKGFDVHISYKSFNDNADPFYFGNSGEYFDTWFDSQEQSGLPPWKVYPEIWKHVCHIFSRKTYTAYWDGKFVFRRDLVGSWPVLMNGTLVLGQEQDNLGGGFDKHQIFRGDLAQVSIWGRVLTESEVFRMSLCMDYGRGDLFSTDTAKMEEVGTQKTLTTLQDLCKSNQHNIVFPEERTVDEAKTFCRRLNASLSVPATSHDNERLKNQVKIYENTCVPTASWKVWLGITDKMEDGVWREFCSETLITYLNFPPLNAGSSYECASMKLDGFWDGDRCTHKRCVACYLEDTDFLYLRGLCYDTSFHKRFKVKDHINGRPYFRGYYNHIIIWNDETRKWLLVDTYTNKTMLSTSSVPESNYPIGKYEWNVETVMCGFAMDQKVLLSLAPCADHLFTCNSGNCIPSHLRCDFRYDCGDGSDEVGCEVVELIDDLQRQLPPTSTGGALVKIAPSVILTRIADVDDINMAITLEFRLTFTWTDRRLRFRHLRLKGNGSILSTGDAEKVWQPRYTLVNLEGGQSQLLGQSLVVRSSNNGSRPPFNSVDRDMVYPGASNQLSLTERYTARVTCYFKLYAYPFDIQLCSVDIELPEELVEYVQLSIEEGLASYTGPKELSKYNVKAVEFSGDSGGNYLSLQFELHRRQGIVVFSNFLPSAMLLVVSWATLFVRLEALNVRAIMALTTLLVLYTLFANLSQSLPATAAIKLIDIWFFFIIFVLFINIMIHVFVDDLPRQPKVTKVKVIKSPLIMGKEDRFCFDLDLSSPRLLKIYRLFILPIIVLLFNVYFWASVLL